MVKFLGMALVYCPGSKLNNMSITGDIMLSNVFLSSLSMSKSYRSVFVSVDLS